MKFVDGVRVVLQRSILVQSCGLGLHGFVDLTKKGKEPSLQPEQYGQQSERRAIKPVSRTCAKKNGALE